MSGKIEKDLGGAAELLLNLFGGEGTTEAVKDALNIGRAATAGIPRRKDDVPPANTANETRRETRNEKNNEDPEVLDMTVCDGCGTFFMGTTCGSCGKSVHPPEADTNPGKRPATNEELYYVAFTMRGVFHEKFISPYQACEQAHKIGGYVRVLTQSQLKGR